MSDASVGDERESRVLPDLRDEAGAAAVKRERNGHGHYGRLGAMAALSFLSMFALMYAMVDSRPNVYVNVNQAYMAGLMVAPMIVFELLLMGAMYRHKQLNAAIVSGSLAIGVVCWLLIRQQAGVGDEQFLRSMIPHHAAAILMCNEAGLSDPRVKQLCENIVGNQRSEIEQMKATLDELIR
jgi:uncharacterized protein (DUF305 family)